MFGPRGGGKTLAVRVLATECNALVIDISPSTIKGKVSDKKSIDGLINSAFRVAKNFQPAIIYCDDYELIFAGKKKKKKGENQVPVDPAFAKMKKPIQDFKKAKFLEPEDRVAFIGTSNRPYDGSIRDFKNFFDKKFYMPYPNYGTRK